MWCEDLTVSPLLWLWSGQVRLTAACWSPARPSVIFSSREDGRLLVRDLLSQQDAARDHYVYSQFANPFSKFKSIHHSH